MFHYSWMFIAVMAHTRCKRNTNVYRYVLKSCHLHANFLVRLASGTSEITKLQQRNWLRSFICTSQHPSSSLHWKWKNIFEKRERQHPSLSFETYHYLKHRSMPLDPLSGLFRKYNQHSKYYINFSRLLFPFPWQISNFFSLSVFTLADFCISNVFWSYKVYCFRHISDTFHS